MEKREQLYEGKAKKVFATDDPEKLIVSYKDDATAFNGEKRGTILGKMPKVDGQDETTNHAGVAEFAGQWYIVYHVSNGPNGGGTYRRQVAVDKLFFNADGTIQPVTPSSALKF